MEIIYNDSANKLFVKDFADLTVQEKQDAMFDAEISHGEEIAELKSEAGMNTLSPGGAARMQEFRNKSKRMIRDGLGDDFKLFKDSMVDLGSVGIDLEDVRLTSKQHKKLHNLYVSFLKKEIAKYPDIKLIEPRNFTRIQWLEDMRDISREMAADELFFEQPRRQRK
jgi:hypothetical protein